MNMKTKQLTACAMLAALTAICAQISIPLPGGVPLTLSLVAVYLCGVFLSPVWAFSAQLVYLLLGAFGLPVYAGFGSGLVALFGPTGGYLLAYPLMALLVALGRKYWGSKPLALAGTMALALLLCYSGGTLWFMASTKTPLWGALTACVIPFVPVDLLKIGLATLVGARLRTLGPFALQR